MLARRRMLCALLLVAAMPSCFAVPRHETIIPAQVAAVMAGGNPAAVDPNGPPMVVRSVWLDRQVALFLDHAADGSHQLDYSQTDDTQNGLAARQSDNARNQANVQAVQSLLGQLVLATLTGAPPAAAAPLTGPP